MTLYTATILKAATEAGLDATKASALTVEEVAVLAGVDAKEPPKDFDAKAEAAVLADWCDGKPVVLAERPLGAGVELTVTHRELGEFAVPIVCGQCAADPKTVERIVVSVVEQKLAEGELAKTPFEPPTASELARIVEWAEFLKLVDAETKRRGL